MLLHPYLDRGRLATYSPTRLLVDGLGIIGLTLRDPMEKERWWTVTQVFAPVEGRMVGGVRAKAVDERGFLTFINQRDLEVLMGIGEVGSLCPWLGTDYVSTASSEWMGMCADEEDLADDLYLQELELRSHSSLDGLLNGFSYQPLSGEPEQQIVRRLHLDYGQDVEELLLLRQDFDPETGEYPDTKPETLMQRWVKVERRKVQWRQLR